MATRSNASSWADQVEQEEANKPRSSWAEILGRGLQNCWQKNILEIVLEKDEKGPFLISHEDCFRLIKKLGIDPRPGIQIEEIQICPNGRGRIYITLSKDVLIDHFCRYDVFEVNSNGVRAVNVKPVNKKEVVVSIKNMHPNTKDEVVFAYLNKFGKVLTNKVIYGVYTEGPLKGFRNGNRSYKMELNHRANLGTYHVIDGHKVIVRYPGQMQTCGRCHKTSRLCKGKGIAKRCEEEQGEKVDFVKYILDLWKEIGYSPESSQLEQVSSEEGDEFSVSEQDGGRFTPVQKPKTLKGDYNGIRIKSFPRDTDHCQIIEFLTEAGLPNENVDNVKIKSNGNVIVADLGAELSQIMIEKLHGKMYYDRKIFCNGMFTLTPEKDVPIGELGNSVDDNLEKPTVVTETPSITLSEPLTPAIASSSLLQLNANQDIAQYLEQNEKNLTNEDLVRRHSLSLRSPPLKSLAKEILDSPSDSPSLHRTKELINQVKEMSTRLSDYESCLSTDGDTGADESSYERFGFTKKRSGKKKRKEISPPKTISFLKKPNTSTN